MRKLCLASCMIAAVLLAFSGCATGGRAKATGQQAKAPSEQAKTTAEEAKAPKFFLRVNCAATEPYTDNAGNVWLPDQQVDPNKEWGAVGGMTVDRGDLAITGTDAPKIYQTERYSMEAYKFNVPNGAYTVRLHFAETYDGITAAGQRIFSVTINDRAALTNFDPYKEAGGFQKPIVKTIEDVAVTGGELVIKFTVNVQNPEINGIEILAR